MNNLVKLAALSASLCFAVAGTRVFKVGAKAGHGLE